MKNNRPALEIKTEHARFTVNVEGLLENDPPGDPPGVPIKSLISRRRIYQFIFRACFARNKLRKLKIRSGWR
ncbi:MAG TPA: hypothetical protein PKY82_06990 [Pyrinomonadaceae bacterium]|jgi:hypothetical protein|nr:hypothetical protein [Pyrinomonadaceae bacterium]